MTRRILAVLLATALAFITLPLAVASAAAAATASLDASSLNLLPGIQNVTVTVRNTGSTLPGALGGSAVNWVDVKLPNTSGVKTTAGLVTPPSGWTVSRTDAGSIQTYTFRGGSVPTGGSQAFTVPVSVTAPLTDRTGQFDISVSDVDGRGPNSSASGTLTATIRTLAVVAGTFRPIAPAGVTDGSATGGQTIEYAFDVKNYARAAQNVSSALTSNGVGDGVTNAAAASVPSGETRSFVSIVQLGAAGTERTSTFTAAASATQSSAQSLQQTLAVQRPAVLSLDPASFAPKSVKPGIAFSFSIEGTKANTPTLKLTSGSITVATATATLLEAPVDVSGNAKKTYAFQPMSVDVVDGQYDAAFTFTGVDSNDFAFHQAVNLTRALTVDALAPRFETFTVTLPADGSGRRQTAVSNDSDQINIAGKLDTCDARLDFVRLVTDKGQTVETTVTRAAGSCDFTARVTTGSPSATFAADTVSFKAVASATDVAGNAGGVEVAGFAVDLVQPLFTYARTIGTGTKADGILVHFVSGTTLYGACHASQWRVEGQLVVSAVTNTDGSPCQADGSSPTGDMDRILVLTSPQDQDYLTNVTYTPGTRPVADPATNAAGLEAIARTVNTVIGVAPAAPVIARVKRADGAEEAKPDAGVYYTRFGGDDLTADITGGRAGYFVQVIDEDGMLLRSEEVSGPQHTVTIPLGTAQRSYKRFLQLINSNGMISHLTELLVVIDQVAPRLDTVTKTGAKAVRVDFSEALTTAGTDFAEDWFVHQDNPDPDPTDPSTNKFVYQVSSVTVSGANSRSITTNENLREATGLGAAYILRSPSGIRYTDRAGNPLADASAI